MKNRSKLQIGLKLWSTNSFYVRPALELYNKGCFDFIELYTVPDSLATCLLQWQDLPIPYTLHAPHFMQGVNLADRSKESFNRIIYADVDKWALALGADKIVFHPGIGGDIKETARQLKSFNDKRIIIENKPLIPPHRRDLRCNGATYEEMEYVLNETGLEFCLDVGHCFCTANSLAIPPMQYFERFLELNPGYFHISDNDSYSEVDSHMHFGEGSMPVAEILNHIPDKSCMAIETKKDSQSNLDDFQRDAAMLKSYMPGNLAECSKRELRRAVLADMDLYYRWVNDPAERENAFNPKTISYDEHCSWFRNRVDSPDSYLWILEEEHSPTGQVRFDLVRTQKKAIVSSYIAPEARGRRLGAEIIKLGMDCLKKFEPDIECIEAVVKPSNVFSKRMLESLGFQRSDEKCENGFITYITEMRGIND